MLQKTNLDRLAAVCEQHPNVRTVIQMNPHRQYEGTPPEQINMWLHHNSHFKDEATNKLFGDQLYVAEVYPCAKRGECATFVGTSITDLTKQMVRFINSLPKPVMEEEDTMDVFAQLHHRFNTVT